MEADALELLKMVLEYWFLALFGFVKWARNSVNTWVGLIVKEFKAMREELTNLNDKLSEQHDRILRVEIKQELENK